MTDNPEDRLPVIYDLKPEQLIELRHAILVENGANWRVLFNDWVGQLVARIDLGAREPSSKELDTILKSHGLTADSWSPLEGDRGERSRLALVYATSELPRDRSTELSWGKWLALGAGLGCLLAIASLPYSFYSGLRFSVTVAAIALCALSIRRGSPMWLLGLVPIAFLMNPIVPVTLGKEVWAIVDLAMAVFFGALFSAYLNLKPRTGPS